MSTRRSRNQTRRGARARLPRFDGRARAFALLALGSVLAYVAAVNGLVRSLGGGDPHPLSPRYQAQKTEALARLGLHAISELGLRPHADARAEAGRAAQQLGVSRPLALALAQVESRFDAHAISHTGAMGMMQLMPETARRYALTDHYAPGPSARAGLRVLRDLLGRYHGDLARAVAAYNLGPGRVPASGSLRLPAETRAYVRAVLRQAARSRPARSPGTASRARPTAAHAAEI